MSLFTEEQLQELEAVFNLKRVETLPVRDGRVCKGDSVWWRCVEGPQHLTANLHWRNIEEFPEAYSIKEPRYTITYTE